MPLDPKQVNAAKLLGKGLSQTEVASQVGVSRRSIVRWLSNPEFKGLCFALSSSSPQQSSQQTPQRSSEGHQPPNRLTNRLTVQDLVEDALRAVQGILSDPDTRVADRLRAAALIGEWAGLASRGKIHELEAFKILLELDFVPEQVFSAVQEAYAECQGKIKSAMGVEVKKSDFQLDESWIDELDEENPN